MHAFGLNKELCDEFLRKQSVISNITKGKTRIHFYFQIQRSKYLPFVPEQEKMLHDNINRMYKETEKWRAN